MPDLKLNKVAEADFPSRFGQFRIYGFEGVQRARMRAARHPQELAGSSGGAPSAQPICGVVRDPACPATVLRDSSEVPPSETEEAVVLKLGDLSPQLGAPLVRIHSQCLTGDVFHSLRCDCRSQLELALDGIVAEGRGLLIYEHQEGRGIGLLNKLRAYELQDGGLDTVEANERLGFDADLRDYALPAAILLYFNVRQVRLLSNNPDKVVALENAGIQVVERAPIIAPPLATTADYMRTKREKLGHLF